jgi:RNA polymerase-binding protein DksA
MSCRCAAPDNPSQSGVVGDDDVDTDKFRSRLEARRAELAARASRAASDLRREHEPLSADFSEQAVQREDDEVLQGISDAAHDELLLIDRALRRVRTGEYLECSRCNAPIGASRLEAVPYTDLCADCARRMHG